MITGKGQCHMEPLPRTQAMCTSRTKARLADGAPTKIVESVCFLWLWAAAHFTEDCHSACPTSLTNPNNAKLAQALLVTSYMKATPATEDKVTARKVTVSATS